MLLTASAVLMLAKPNLHSILENVMSSHKLPALGAAVILDGKIVAFDAIGVRKLGDPTKVQPNDQFHIGSNTKAMTATLCAILVERGKLKWNATLEQVFPDLAGAFNPAFRKVTLEQLLANRGGFPTDIKPGGKDLWSMHSLKGSPSEQRLEFLRLIVKVKPAYTPGSEFVYSNANFSVAASMAEKVMGESYESLMDNLIFKPLQITTAGFGPAGMPNKVDQPWQHTVEGSNITPIGPGIFSDNPVCITPAGRIHIAMEDWAKFAVASLIPGALLSKDSMTKLQSPVGGSEYAMGWMVLRRSWSGGPALYHNGSNNQNFSVAWLSPSKKFGVVIATNIAGEDAQAAADEVASTVVQSFLLGIARS